MHIADDSLTFMDILIIFYILINLSSLNCININYTEEYRDMKFEKLKMYPKTNLLYIALYDIE